MPKEKFETNFAGFEAEFDAAEKAIYMEASSQQKSQVMQQLALQ